MPTDRPPEIDEFPATSPRAPGPAAGLMNQHGDFLGINEAELMVSNQEGFCRNAALEVHPQKTMVEAKSTETSADRPRVTIVIDCRGPRRRDTGRRSPIRRSSRPSPSPRANSWGRENVPGLLWLMGRQIAGRGIAQKGGRRFEMLAKQGVEGGRPGARMIVPVTPEPVRSPRPMSISSRLFWTLSAGADDSRALRCSPLRCSRSQAVLSSSWPIQIAKLW